MDGFFYIQSIYILKPTFKNILLTLKNNKKQIFKN